MGSSQSSISSSCDYGPALAKSDDNKIIRPYGLAQNSKYIQLNSSYCTLYDGIVSLVRNNNYADLLIICGDDRYPVHRAIVCPRSKLFEDQCALRDGEQDYSSPSEPTKIWIDPSECESHVLAAVLTFLYILDYSANGQQALTFGLPEEVGVEEDDQATLRGRDSADSEEEHRVESEEEEDSSTTWSDQDPTPSETPSNHSSYTKSLSSDPGELRNELLFHIQTFSAGQRLGIRSLCVVAKEKLVKRLNSGPWASEMVGCIREVYRHGNGAKLVGLKEIVVKSAKARFRVLKNSEGWDDLILECPEFAADMLRRL